MKTSPSASPSGAVFHKVAQNLYRLESSGGYYALFKRAGKQIRRSLKTTDSLLARQRSKEFGGKVSRLNQTKGANKIIFGELWKRWLDNHRVNLKEKSLSRLDTCLKGLTPAFEIRNRNDRTGSPALVSCLTRQLLAFRQLKMLRPFTALSFPPGRKGRHSVKSQRSG